MLPVKVINTSNNPLPKYATQGSAGLDICAHITQTLSIAPFERVLVNTGLYIELPAGYEAQLRIRSGLALKKGLILPNAPATIDSDYRGELKVIIANLSQQTQTIENGERIAQLIVARYEQIEWQTVEQLSSTPRGENGFGSTGSL